MRYKHPFFVLFIAASILLTACAPLSVSVSPEDSSDEDREAIYTGELFFDGRRYAYTGDPADIIADNDSIIIRKSGTYLVTGKLTEGQMTVECVGDVSLIFGGFEGCNSDGAVVERSDGGSLCLSALPNTVNILSTVLADTPKSADTPPVGCVSSGGRLVLTGNGRLTVSSASGSAIVCSDLYMNGGELTVSCSEYGVWAKNSVKLLGGSLTLTTARVGIYACGAGPCDGNIDILKGSRVTALCRETVFLADGKLTVTSEDTDLLVSP